MRRGSLHRIARIYEGRRLRSCLRTSDLENNIDDNITKVQLPRLVSPAMRNSLQRAYGHNFETVPCSIPYQDPVAVSGQVLVSLVELMLAKDPPRYA